MQTLPAYNVVDIIAGIILIMGMIQGFRRGLSGELAGMVSAVVAVWGGWQFYRPLGDRIMLSTRLTEHESYALAFFLAVLAAFLLMLLIRVILKNLMEFTFKGALERVGGLLAGLLRTGIIVAAVIFLFSLWPHAYLHRTFAEDSLAGRFLSTHIPPAYENLTERYPRLPRPRRNSDRQEQDKDINYESETH